MEGSVEIIYSKSALRFLAKLDKKSVSRMREAIEGLKHMPPLGDIKAMQGYDDGRKRLRVGQWRIIFRIDVKNNMREILILDIGNRGDIYK